MATETVTYFNGRKYKRRIRTAEMFNPTMLRTFITFAYRGVTDEWPVIISYTIR